MKLIDALFDIKTPVRMDSAANKLAANTEFRVMRGTKNIYIFGGELLKLDLCLDYFFQKRKRRRVDDSALADFVKVSVCSYKNVISLSTRAVRKTAPSKFCVTKKNNNTKTYEPHLTAFRVVLNDKSRRPAILTFLRFTCSLQVPL